MLAAGDQDHEQQPAGVDGDMTFAAVGLLPGVVAAAGPPDGFRGAQRLGVDQRGGGLPVKAFDVLADLFAQAVVHPVQGSVTGPPFEFRVPSQVHRLK
jgi:hypothetical protein